MSSAIELSDAPEYQHPEDDWDAWPPEPLDDWPDQPEASPDVLAEQHYGRAS